MAKNILLEKVFEAIAQLRAEGIDRLTISKVSRYSGVARATFYLDDDDWREVREVIAGKPSSRVELVEVKIVEESEHLRELRVLTDRVASAEQEVQRLEEVATKVYQELIDEVQRWFHEASEKPKRHGQLASCTAALGEARDRIQDLITENQILRAASEDVGNLAALAIKKVINLDSEAGLADVVASFLTQLSKTLPRGQVSEALVTAYIVCGLPHSGKSTWIKQHKPSLPGLHIYIDWLGHKTEYRRFVISHLREHAKAKIVGVWVRADRATCQKRIDQKKSGVDAALSSRSLERVCDEFEEPSLYESYNEVLLVKSNEQ